MKQPVLIKMPEKFHEYGTELGFDAIPTRYDSWPRFIVPTPYRRFGYIGIPSGPAFGTLPYASVAGNNRFWQSLQSNGLLLNGSFDTAMVNQAYSRMVEKIQTGGRRDLNSDKAELGVTLLEYSKTAEWVRESSEALADYVSNVRYAPARRIAKAKQRVRAARRKARGVKTPELTDRQKKTLLRKRWAAPRWLSSRWLEFWMVVLPTIGDLHTGLQVLSRDVHFGNITGTSKKIDNWTYRSVWGNDIVTDECKTTARIRMGCHVTCTNPNMALANSLGLLNPFSAGLELVPWTWLIGWFVNWKQVLDSWSDFAGYSITNGYTSRSYKSQGQRYRKIDGWVRQVSYEGYGIDRTTNLSYPKLVIRLPNKLSITRAATAISLVVNKLT